MPRVTQRSQLSKSVASRRPATRRQRPAAAHLERAALAFRRQRRQQAVGGSTMSVVCRCGVPGSVAPERSAGRTRPSQSPADRRRRGRRRQRCAAYTRLPSRTPCSCRRADRRSEWRWRTVRAECRRPASCSGWPDVGFTPRRLRVDPAFRGRDEVVGFAGRPRIDWPCGFTTNAAAAAAPRSTVRSVRKIRCILLRAFWTK
jgi:hypothetical protein